MSALDVLPLALAKRYVGIPASDTSQDTELAEDFIPPAVQRVERWVFGGEPGGEPLGHFDPATVTAIQRLALKEALRTYFATQARGLGGRQFGGGAVSAAAIAADTDPAGDAPLRAKLADLLGPPKGTPVERTPPAGHFPPPAVFPDPALTCRHDQWSGGRW